LKKKIRQILRAAIDRVKKRTSKLEAMTRAIKFKINRRKMLIGEKFDQDGKTLSLFSSSEDERVRRAAHKSNTIKGS